MYTMSSLSEFVSFHSLLYEAHETRLEKEEINEWLFYIAKEGKWVDHNYSMCLQDLKGAFKTNH